MFARVHKAERAVDMFNLMKAEKIEPNKATYAFLIEGNLIISLNITKDSISIYCNEF